MQRSTEQLAAIIAQTGYEDLDTAVITAAKQAILDAVAVGLLGSSYEAPAIASEHVKGLGGNPQATVWGMGFKTSVVQAAYLNGISTHVLDYEPMWSPPTHPMSPTVPVALALGELRKATGREIIAACVKGWEVQGRFLYAAKQYVPAELTQHPPGIVGVMGGAVVAAHLLGLSQERLCHALGTAASRAAALLGNIGTMTKSNHCGFAGAAGLDAALLAERGYTANMGIIEHEKGYVNTFFSRHFEYEVLLQFGKPFRVVDPGLSFKLFPSQYATHFGITGALELHRQIPETSRIARVQITTPVMPYVDRPLPETGLDGKFSYQYTAACGLLDGKVNANSFSDSRRFSRDMVNLLNNITLTQSREIPGDFEGMRVEIEVEMVDGQRLASVCRAPKGFWKLGRLKREEHLPKVLDCLASNLTPTEANRVIEIVEGLEECDDRAVAELTALLGKTGKP